MDYSAFFGHVPPAYQFTGIPSTGAFAANAKLAEPLHDVFPPHYESLSYGSVVPSAEVQETAPLPMAGIESTGVPEGYVELLPLQPQDASDRNGQPGLLQRRGSSEDKDQTPAKSRRQAQNRAAQRAFRERKEQHVKDLEAKLSALESSAETLASDNERLKIALQRVITENELLRSKTSSAPTLRPNPGSTAASPPLNHNSSPPSSSHSPKAAPSSPLAAGAPSTTAAVPPPPPPSSDVSADDKLVSALATWDVIRSHPLVEKGHVDVADVFERLRDKAQCDGEGPAFAESEIRKAIESSRRACGDGLI